MDIVDQIITIRKQKGISQQQLADMTGILQPVIARVESKKSRPTIDFINKLLNALDMELKISDSFYCPDEIMKKIKGLKRKNIPCDDNSSKAYNIENKYVLKISNQIDQINEEKEKIEWLSERLLCGKVVNFISENNKAYLLSKYLNGHVLNEKQYRNSPYRLIKILKDVVDALRNLDAQNCPFKSNVSKGKDFVIGNLSLSNIVVDDKDKLVGFNDVSNSGNGNKRYDYSWLILSFEKNLKTDKYTDLLIKELNIKVAREHLSNTVQALIEANKYYF